MRAKIYLVSLIASLLAAVPFTALAGDRAAFELIGFSGDGRYFAFEEYGIQDGSGFAYSNIYVIDLATDSWVDGSPIRQQSTMEGDLSATRGQAIEAAIGALESVNLSVPAMLLSLNGDGDPRSDGLSLDYGIPDFANPTGTREEATLSLNIFKAPSQEACVDYIGEEPMGFALLHKRDGSVIELYRDDTIPRSRGCPLTYKIFAVAAPFPGYDLSNSVALISVYRYGFEGPDRRFIAVPVSR